MNKSRLVRSHLLALLLALGVTGGSTALAQDTGGLQFDLPMLGQFQLHPYLELKVTHDDNVLLADDGEEQDSVFYSGRVGVDQQKGFGPVRLGLDAWYFVERYDDVDEADDEDFAMSMDLGIGDDHRMGVREKLEFNVVGDYTETDQVDYETGDIEDTTRWRLGGGLGKSFGTRADADLLYTHSEYGFNSGSSFDTSEDAVRLDLADHFTDKTSGLLVGEYASQDSDAAEGSDTEYAVRSGVAYKTTEKSRVSGTVGYTHHDRFDSDAFSWEANADWMPTDRLQLDASGRNEFEPSVRDDNVNLQTTLQAGARYQLWTKVAARTQFTYHDNKLEEDSAVSEDSETWSGRLYVAYHPPGKWYTIFTDAVYEARDSDVINDDYEKTTVSLGAILRY